jgi:hypothetical protein
MIPWLSVTFDVDWKPIALPIAPVYSTWRMERELKSPKIFKSHRTPMTTTAFKIDLIDAAIGMYRLTSPRRTPTKMRTSTS